MTTATYSFGTPSLPEVPLAPEEPAARARRAGRAAFHALRVVSVEPLADESVTLTVAVPPELAQEYAFTAGQHLTFRADVDGHAVRRSYSICDPAPLAGGPRTLRVGIKRLSGGAFSSWVHDTLQPGEEIDVMTPQGHFSVVPDPSAKRRHVAIAAGSGITPVLSIVSTLLRDEPESEVTLLYGNRRTSSVMFLEELADLKDRYPDRLQVLHVMSREAQDADLLCGRLEPRRVQTLLDAFVADVTEVDGWYLCGPFEMVTGVRELLARRGVAAASVHTELFYVEDAPPVTRTREEEEHDAGEAEVVVSLDGRTSTIRMRSRAQNILAATLQVRADAPFSCTNGVCGTCRARLVEGEVRMDRNFALEPEEIERGIVLTCQAHPVTDRVVLDYDA
ncbi:MAG: 1,2-phenylacetyl-CoA epoxidase subunit PaaE [Actinomycetes bacterium]